MKFRLSFFLLSTFCVFGISAQTIQNGVVQEYNEKAKKTSLAGVELNVRSANTTASDKDGKFSLEFLTLKPGEKVNVRRIEKAGYDIFNKEAVEQWNINPSTPFVIVMCRSDKFKTIRDNYERVASENYEKQYKKEQARLAKLKEDGKLKEEEYRSQLADLRNEYDRQLDNLDNYVDKFSRIDLSELSSVEQEIIGLVQQGKFDEAIQKYEEQNYLEKYRQEVSDIKQVTSAIDQLADVKQSKEQSRDSLLSAINRQIETLKLAGGYDNNMKILSIMENLFNADTTNINNSLKLGKFVLDFTFDFALAEKYVKSALNQAQIQSGHNNDYEARAYNIMGLIYNRSGKYNKAIELFSKSAQIKEELYGKKDVGISDDYNNLAIVYDIIGDFDKSMEYNQSSLDIVLDIYGENHVETAACFHNIAALYKDMGEYSAALEYYKKALGIRETELSKMHSDIGVTLNNIAVIYNILGDYSQSMEYYKRALDIFLHNYGQKHPYVANSIDNIGSVYEDLGLYDNAIDYYTKALEMRLDILGNNHPNVAVSYVNLGSIYARLHQYDEAKNCFLNAIAIFSQIYQADHPDLATCYNNMGAIYFELKDYQNAEDYFEKGLSIRRKNLGEEHLDIATSYGNLGNVYYSMNDCDKAIEYNLKALDIKRRILGDNHLDIAVSYSNIGNIYLDMKDYDKAMEYFIKSLAIKENVLGENNIKLTPSLSNLGVLYYKLQEYNQALIYLKRSLEILKANTKEDSEDIVNLYDCISMVYIKMGDSKSALYYNLLGLKFKEQQLGPKHPELAYIYSGIAMNYYSMGDFENALLYEKKSIEIDELNIPQNNEKICKHYIMLVQTLEELSKNNDSYKEEKARFMSDKIWAVSIIDGDSPASRLGLNGKYFVLGYGDWYYNDDRTLIDVSKTMSGKPKDIIFLKDNDILLHHFEDKVGVNFTLIKITPVERNRIENLWNDWKIHEGIE